MLKAQGAGSPRRPGEQIRVVGNAFAFAPARMAQGHSSNPKFGVPRAVLSRRTRARRRRDISMANKMLIDATHPEETRVVVLRGNRVEEFDFESGKPPAAARQYLSRQGHARRTVAAGRLRRLRRQPPRLPRLQRNPSRLLPNPGRRPAGADRRGRARAARRRGRDRTPRATAAGAGAHERPRGASADASARSRCEAAEAATSAPDERDRGDAPADATP